MSATSRRPEADPLYARPAPQRPHYATGILLDAGDFRDEQTYHRGRLANAVAALTGGGTLAGLRVVHVPGDEDVVEEIRVTAGLAADRLGRLVEVSRPACLRLERWWEATLAEDEGDTLVRATYDDVEWLEEELALVNREIERLKPLAEKYEEIREKNRRSAKRPRKNV